MPEAMAISSTTVDPQQPLRQTKSTSVPSPNLADRPYKPDSTQQASNGTTSSPTSAPASSPNHPKLWSVQSALSSLPVSSLPSLSPPPSSPVPFLHLLERLKTSPRAGWTRFNVPNSESISDHMYRMSMICLLAPSSLTSTLDTNKCMRLALVHDMAESVVGDITPVDGVSKAEKERRERDTMAFFESKMLPGYDGGRQGKMLKEIWEEYEAGSTPEAKFVKDVDKLELLLQMTEYERRANGEMDLGEFGWVKDYIRGDVCKAWAEEVLQERNRFWEAVGRVPKGPREMQAEGVVGGNGEVNGAGRTEKEEWEHKGEEKGVVFETTPGGDNIEK